MEELKEILSMIVNLPGMALWVLGGYLLYKLSILGSIYSTIRFSVEKFYNYKLTKYNFELKEKEVPVVLRDKFYGLTIHSDSTLEELISQIRRVAGKGLTIESNYIHSNSVDWLRKAIDAKILEDLKNGK